MSTLLTLSGTIIRTTDIENRAYLPVSAQDTITADELSTVGIAPTGSFVASFVQVPTGSFVALQADRPVDLTLNGLEPLRVREIYLSGTRVLGITISNPDAQNPVKVRLLVGG